MAYMYIVGYLYDDFDDEGFGIQYLAKTEEEGLEALSKYKRFNGGAWALVKMPVGEAIDEVRRYIIKEVI